MIVTLHTGITGYRLALGEVAPVLNTLAKRTGIDFTHAVVRDVAPVDGAPNAVVTSDATFTAQNFGHRMAVASSGPLSEAQDICDALDHMNAGRVNEPMCPRALKRLSDFRRLADVVSNRPQLTKVCAIQVPEQRIYWLIAEIGEPKPEILGFTMTVSRPQR